MKENLDKAATWRPTLQSRENQAIELLKEIVEINNRPYSKSTSINVSILHEMDRLICKAEKFLNS